MFQLKVEAKVEEYLKEYQTRRKEILSALPEAIRQQIEESDEAQVVTAKAAIDAAKPADAGEGTPIEGQPQGEGTPSGVCYLVKPSVALATDPSSSLPLHD